MLRNRRLMLIGWDSADWPMIHPLMDRGEMPHLASLVENGVMGNLASLSPMLSPLLWTSIATGKTADVHGILGFVEPTPDGSAIRTIRGTSRKVSALWNICESQGLPTIVVNWYATYPAERTSGTFVSNAFFDSKSTSGDAATSIDPRSVSPASRIEAMNELRIRSDEISPADLAPWIPSLAWMPGGRDTRPGRLAEILARDLSAQAIFTDALARDDWRFATVCFDGLDAAGHVFMPFHPPRMDHVPTEDFAEYRNVMNQMYRFYDRMLGAALQFADENTTVMLVSDHGFHNDHRRPRSIPGSLTPEAEAAAWHARFGIFAMQGPGIRKDERIYGATLLHIAPTALHALGLPAGSDMPARPLLQCWNSIEPVRIESIECEVDIEPGRKVAAIESVRLASDILEPGQELKAFVTLRPYKGEREVVELALAIPTDFPEGVHEAVFSDMAGALRRRFRNEPTLAEPRDLPALIRTIRAQTDPKRTSVFLQVSSPERGLAVQGQELPNLPGSVRAAFASRKEVPAQLIRSDLTSVGATSWVLEGTQSLRFTVAKDAGLSLSSK